MKFLFIILTTVALTGCSGLDRLLGQGGDPEPRPVEVIGGPSPIGEMPDFGLPERAGFTLKSFHGALPLGGVVPIEANAGASLKVFLKQRLVGIWFLTGPNVSDGFWYTADLAAGTVTYHGQNLDLIEYCVYEYVPQ